MHSQLAKISSGVVSAYKNQSLLTVKEMMPTWHKSLYPGVISCGKYSLDFTVQDNIKGLLWIWFNTSSIFLQAHLTNYIPTLHVKL